MTREGDTLRKRALFEAWMAEHQPFSVPVAEKGEPIHRRTDEVTPAYIGKTRTPATRWNQHLTALGQGEGHYARWRQRFLREGHETVRFDLDLLVVGEAHIAFPPLPGFPTTIGAVEYQLVGLAADAYPLRLLNHEGQAR